MRNQEVFQEIIEARRSNRAFDANVDVPKEVIERSLERAHLAPNSSNMQLWEFYWIKSQEALKTMAPLCLNQQAAKTAKQMVVFVTREDKWKERAEWNAERIREQYSEEIDKQGKEGLKYYEKLIPLVYGRDPFGFFTLLRRIICFFGGLNKPFVRLGGKSDQRVVVHKSCALAAENFMLSIAAEGFESCPMEGFDKIRVKKYLGLPRKAEINMVIAVGKGTEKGIWGKRNRVDLDTVVKVK